ncbi:HIT family protein [Paenibacillus sp. sptzw28]|uniref:HIT family protein n=1 Tax=Paenibacillus sp. sptzw28 TaxID=715179 RepID=UPI001C6F443A|nr:HIT family protein [Paenibacillus sp. sptzw28]QYR22315.1 HIT family protein [Paenibacillus sp. sptzw28]
MQGDQLVLDDICKIRWTAQYKLLLILPKGHYHNVDDLDEITANEIMKASRLLASLLNSHFQPDGVTILQNNGKFNDLNHYHMHIFPRYESDGFAWVEPSDSTNAKGRLKETTTKLVELINQQSLR